MDTNCRMSGGRGAPCDALSQRPEMTIEFTGAVRNSFSRPTRLAWMKACKSPSVSAQFAWALSVMAVPGYQAETLRRIWRRAGQGLHTSYGLWRHRNINDVT